MIGYITLEPVEILNVLKSSDMLTLEPVEILIVLKSCDRLKALTCWKVERVEIM